MLECAVVLAAIYLGVRAGGIGLGLWGIAGTAVLVLAFRLDPAKFIETNLSAISVATDTFLIIIAVIAATSVMQAGGGIDWLVDLASRIIRRYPKRITYVAPLIAMAFTAVAGTSTIFFALIPVIYETSYQNGVRPERPLAAATVTSGLGITVSPISAAMVTLLNLLGGRLSLWQVLAITIPSSLAACVMTSLVMSGIGDDLVDDAEYQRRLRAGLVQPRTGAADGKRKSLPATASRSALVFLGAVLIVLLLCSFEQLRKLPHGEVSRAMVIELVMGAAACLILVVCRIHPEDVPRQPLFQKGIVAAIALFGIALMGLTFFCNNEKTMIGPLTSLIKEIPVIVPLALFVVAGLTTSQNATTAIIIPVALSILPPPIVAAIWPSVVGVWLFPANGSQIAAVNIDLTGSTRFTGNPTWHSFTIPMVVSWTTVVVVGVVIALWLY